MLKGTRFTVSQTLAELADSAGAPEVAARFDLDEKIIRDTLYGLSLLADNDDNLFEAVNLYDRLHALLSEKPADHETQRRIAWLRERLGIE